MSDILQDVGVNTLLTTSSKDINSQYTQIDASNRLSTIANILSQKFGVDWKLILIFVILLLLVIFIAIIIF